MSDDVYSEYIRSVLGYPNQKQYNPNYLNNSIYNFDDELDKYYPEIYKIVYPMVTKACDSNRGEVTKEFIEDLTDEIYYAIENNNEINIQINSDNEIQNNNVQNTSQSRPENRNKKDIKELKEMKNDRSSRNMNPLLRDLIKILILRELTGKPQISNRPPMGPPFYGHPGFEPRPPFPGRTNRPPMRPRIYEDDFENLYE